MPFIKLAALLRPFEDFFKKQASGGLVLLATTALALALANSPWRDAYHHFWEIELSIGADGFGLSRSLHHWINEGLMAVFFFVVGLEIKREFIAGELASTRKAALPIAAAIGGMLVPALLFILINPDLPAKAGWGIPMATDIAFALGVIALLGNRIPRSLAIFLTALAIVDDLGAVVVIALFYTGDISMTALGFSGLCFAILVAANRLDVQQPNFYTLVGLLLWLALLQSGLHASIAGVLIGATIPVRARHPDADFIGIAEKLLDRLRLFAPVPGPFHDDEKLGTLLALEHACHDSMSPLQRMEHEMNPWVIYGVMPIFALANAGISLDSGQLLDTFASPVAIGVGVGLLLGKPLGIFLFSWLAVRMKLCDLPSGSHWVDIFGLGILGGIGFTMSMFITTLAYPLPELVIEAKIGIFSASLLAGLFGYALLYRHTRHPHP